MDKKRLYKRLRNGKGVQTFYLFSEEKSYTIRINQKGDGFQLHTFNFQGNDVMDEDNYHDEKIRFYTDYDKLIETIEREFPGIELKL